MLARATPAELGRIPRIRLLARRRPARSSARAGHVITFRLKRGRALANSQAGCGRRRVAGMTTLGDPTAWLMMQSITNRSLHQIPC
jgi:hypothetical protein